MHRRTTTTTLQRSSSEGRMSTGTTSAQGAHLVIRGSQGWSKAVGRRRGCSMAAGWPNRRGKMVEEALEHMVTCKTWNGAHRRGRSWRGSATADARGDGSCGNSGAPEVVRVRWGVEGWKRVTVLPFYRRGWQPSRHGCDGGHDGGFGQFDGDTWQWEMTGE